MTDWTDVLLIDNGEYWWGNEHGSSGSVDSSGYPHFALIDSWTNHSVEHVYWNGTEFLHETIRSETGNLYWACIWMDGLIANVIVVEQFGAYPYTYDIVYYTNASGSWVSSMISDNQSATPNTPCIRVDANNKVHVVWRDGGTGSSSTVRYATNVTGTWVIETIVSNRIESHNLLLTSNNIPLLLVYAYPTSGDYTLTLYTRNGATWDTDIVVSDSTRKLNGHDANIDANDVIHIYFMDAVAEYVGYVYGSVGSWSAPIQIYQTDDEQGKIASFSCGTEQKIMWNDYGTAAGDYHQYLYYGHTENGVWQDAELVANYYTYEFEFAASSNAIAFQPSNAEGLRILYSISSLGHVYVYNVQEV